MIEYRETQEVDLDQLVALIRAAGWNRGDDPARLEKQLQPQEIADLFEFLTLDRPPHDPQARRIPGTPR